MVLRKKRSASNLVFYDTPCIRFKLILWRFDQGHMCQSYTILHDFSYRIREAAKIKKKMNGLVIKALYPPPRA